MSSSETVSQKSFFESTQWQVIKEFWFFFRQNKGAVAGLAVILGFILVAIFAPLLAPYGPAQVNPEAFRLHPVWVEGGTWAHILGTDDLGRDLLSRLIYGARVSLGVGFFVVILAVSAGTALGLLAGYRGGWIDTVIMRGVDILMSLPSILLAIVVVAILGPSLSNAVIAVSVVEIPKFVRLVRAAVLTEKSKVYVMASQSFGASHWLIFYLIVWLLLLCRERWCSVTAF